jgi:hypothetical protein
VENVFQDLEADLQEDFAFDLFWGDMGDVEYFGFEVGDIAEGFGDGIEEG